MPVYIMFHSLIDELSWAVTLLIAVFEPMLFMIVPHDLLVH